MWRKSSPHRAPSAISGTGNALDSFPTGVCLITRLGTSGERVGLRVVFHRGRYQQPPSATSP